MKLTARFAVMALAIAPLAASSALRPRANKPKTLVDPALFDTLVHYATYCATYPVAPCQIPPKGTVVQGYANANATHTEMTIFQSDAYKELVMAFPGSADAQDFITDNKTTLVPYVSAGINCPGCMVHMGVLTAWNSILPQAEQALIEAIQAYPSYKVIVAGHSLGGAITHFAFLGLKSQGFPIQAAYSYGEFRVGNQAFADFSDKVSGSTDEDEGIYFRVTHANDGVPQAVPESLGYRHSRTEYWEMDGTNGEPPTAKTTYRCYGQEPDDCNDSAGGVGINLAHLTYPGINVTGCGGFGNETGNITGIIPFLF